MKLTGQILFLSAALASAQVPPVITLNTNVQARLAARVTNGVAFGQVTNIEITWLSQTGGYTGLMMTTNLNPPDWYVWTCYPAAVSNLYVCPVRNAHEFYRAFNSTNQL